MAEHRSQNKMLSYRRETALQRALIWPIWQQITLKIAVLVYKCQHGMAPQSYCKLASTVSSWQLKSARSGRLTVPCT